MSDLLAVRSDVWLWSARFFKTRRLAREALDGGKVQVNGATGKPSKLLKPGDRLQVSKGQERWEIEVLALSTKRGPASEAQTLYREDAASQLAREEQRAMARLSRPLRPAKRPDKAARRKLRDFKHNL